MKTGSFSMSLAADDVAAPAAPAPPAGKTEKKGDKTTEKPVEPVPEAEQPSRWLIEPGGRVRLLLKFYSEEIINYQASLGFEVVGGVAKTTQRWSPQATALKSQSTSRESRPSQASFLEFESVLRFDLRGISSEPRNVFMRRVKSKPASGYACKQYVASAGKSKDDVNKRGKGITI